MIVVDTNVISELMRGEPHPAVLSWVAAQPRALLYAIYVSQAEILYGIAALPEGRRRKVLAAAAEAMFAEDFAGRLLPFEARAAARYPEVVLTRRQAGQPEAVNSQNPGALSRHAHYWRELRRRTPDYGKCRIPTTLPAGAYHG